MDNLCAQNDVANYPLTCQIIYVVKSYQRFSKAQTSMVTMHFTAAHSPRLCVVIRLLFKHIYTTTIQLYHLANARPQIGQNFTD